MPIEFNCEFCSKLLRVPAGTGGKQCQCPGCSKILVIPLAKVETPTGTHSSNNGTDVALCIPCPKCKHELICDPSLVGTKGQCRSCKHIFVISDLPTNDAPSSERATNWVFSCPKCNQLFEGSEEMRGRRGKCHACGAVFPIELRIAEVDPVENHIEKPVTPSSSFESHDDDLTLHVLPDEAKIKPERAEKPYKKVTSSGTVVSRVSRGDSPAIQFNCPSCSGRMEVPGEAARQLTHCPHCKKQRTVPSESEPTPEDLASDPWANLSPPGSAPAPMPQSNPFGDTLYPPPMPMSSMSTSRMSGTRRRSGGDGGMHIMCGVFIAICACLGIAVEILYIVLGTVTLMLPNVDPMRPSIQIFTASLMFILSLLQLVGGISLARRRGLYMARTAAVICCLPCVCLLLNIPFGIWGCILTFDKNAERDFR